MWEIVSNFCGLFRMSELYQFLPLCGLQSPYSHILICYSVFTEKLLGPMVQAFGYELGQANKDWRLIFKEMTLFSSKIIHFLKNISDSVDEKITCQTKVATLVQRCPCNSEDKKTQCGLQYKKLFHSLKPCNLIVWINL